MHKVAKDLHAYFVNKYGDDSNEATRVGVLLQESKFSAEHAKKLDDVVKTELERMA